jgi:hypothetical protein
MKEITGSWQDARGNFASYAHVNFKLNQDATAIGSGRVVPKEVYFWLNVMGKLTDAEIWANDELEPAGTYYRMTVTTLSGGVIAGPETLILEGPSPIDLNALVPLPGGAAILPDIEGSI